MDILANWFVNLHGIAQTLIILGFYISLSTVGNTVVKERDDA